jgi:hypothetical protein
MHKKICSMSRLIRKKQVEEKKDKKSLYQKL